MRRSRKSKYGNRKVVYAGDTFDSQRELDRFIELRLLERAGKISNLRRQVRYTLIPSQRGEDGRIKERECVYIADFVYTSENGSEAVEDTKGFRTAEYIIKRKLMLWVHGISIKEV